MTEASPTRPTRWRPLILIAVMAAIAFGRIYLIPGIDSSFRFPYAVLAAAVTLLLAAVWFLVSTNLRWRTRFAVLAACGLFLFTGAFAIRTLTRSNGFTGAGVPTRAWKWTPKPDEDLSRFPVPAADAKAVDLGSGSPFDWPQFLGPGRSNAVSGVHLARDWATHPPKQLWRQPIGSGWSSFAVIGDYAFTQEQRGGDEMTVCYEVATGRPRWLHPNPIRFGESYAGDGPRATPTVAGGRVYALGATGILDCLDAANGKLIWSRDVLKDAQAPNLSWGKTTSPLVVDDLVVVAGGDAHGPTLLAYRTSTGENAWTAGGDKSSYSSPTLATLAGVRQILQVGATGLGAYDPASGHILWSYPWAGDTIKASQPVALDGDRIFLSAGYGVGCVLLHIRNGDEGLRAHELWKNPHLKTKFSNVAVRDGFIYGFDEEILACIELATGKRRWRDGAYGFGQLVLVNDTLLIQAEDGDVALVEANPQGYHEVAKFPALKGKSWTEPVLVDHRLLGTEQRRSRLLRIALTGSAAIRGGADDLGVCSGTFIASGGMRQIPCAVAHSQRGGSCQFPL